MKATLRLCAVVLASSTILAAQGPTADWPQWRGPNRDGSAPSFTPPAQWPDSLTERWKVDVGIGYASPVLIGDRLFVFARQGEDEVVMALDAANGREVWSSRYAAPYEPVAAAAPHGKGPKSTPAYGNGKLFTLGISGILTAFDAGSGQRLWQRPAPEAGPIFTTSQSPIYDRGLLIVHVGGSQKGALTAFDPDTGSTIWEWTGDGPAYGSPVIAEIGGTRQVITFTWRNLVGVSAETGELLWRRPFMARFDVNSITPIVSNGTVYVSSADQGVQAIRVVRQGNTWTTEELWRTDDTYFRLSNFVLLDDTIYGLGEDSRGRYVILDAKTGDVLWGGEGRAADQAAFQRAGNLLLVLEGDGDLLVADATDRSAFVPLHHYKVGEGNTWGAPAISGNRIFVRNDASLALWTID